MVCWWVWGWCPCFPTVWQELWPAETLQGGSVSCAAWAWAMGWRVLGSIPTIAVGSEGGTWVCCPYCGHTWGLGHCLGVF